MEAKVKSEKKFEYTISLLKNPIHPVPEKIKGEIDFVMEILRNGQGYLTKSKPVKVIFFDDNAVK